MIRPDIRKRFGDTLRHFRETAGISLKDFGDDIGKNQYYVMQLEDGMVIADILVIEKCAEALGIEIAELFVPATDAIFFLNTDAAG